MLQPLSHMSITATANTSSMDVDDLRDVTIGTLAVALGVAAGLLLTFWVVLDPPDLPGCLADLPDSDYKSALVPAHLLALLAASGCIWLLDAARRGREMPGTLTLVALAAVWVYVGLCLADTNIFVVGALLGVFAGPTLGLVILFVVSVRALATARSSADAELRWQQHSFSVEVLLWTALVLGVPCSLSYAWLNGADLFCF